MTLLTLIAMAVSLIVSGLTTASPERELGGRRHLDQIFSGSFASGATEDCKNSDLLLVNWNIARGRQRPETLQALRGPLAADLYLFQEVDLHTRRTGYRNVADEIARELAMNYTFGIEFEELAQGRPELPAFQGQAVLSRCPISRPRVLRFRHQLHNWGPRWKKWLGWSWLQPRRGGRMALVAEIQQGSQPWVIYNVHLESKANDTGRTKQIREVLEDIHTHYTLDTPVIVAGDLNTKEGADSPVVQELRAAGFREVFQMHKGSLRTKVRSNRTADWIFVRHLRFSDARILKLTTSDHYPLMVRLSLPSRN